MIAGHHAFGDVYFEEPGQFHTIGIASLERRWANSRPLVALLGRSFEPTGGCWQHLGLGQPHSISSTALEYLWAITLLVMPVWKRAGPIPFHWGCLFREEICQLEAIGSTAWEKLWANRRLLAVSGIGPTHSIGSAVLE